jgi:hypothetical protein
MENQESKKPFSYYILKLDRVVSWVLFVVIIAFGITGYGMTKGIIDRQIARTLHFEWLGIIGLIALVIHTSWNIHMTFKRWGIWNTFTKILLTAFYVALVAFFIHLELLSK